MFRDYPKNAGAIYYTLLGVFIALHVYFSIFNAPPPSNRLGLNQDMMLALRYSLLIFYWMAWLFGIRSVIALHTYAAHFRSENPEKERGLSRVGWGILALTGNLALASIVGAIRNVVDMASSATKWLTITTNYLHVVMPLLGLVLIFSGARLLAGRRIKDIYPRGDHLIAAVFSIIATTLYAVLIFTNPFREFSSNPAIRATYYLPDMLIFFTIVLPSLMMWFIGILAAFQINRFVLEKFSSNHYVGRRKLVNGLLAVIFSSILIQSTLALGPRLVDLGLAFILLAVYGIVLMLAYAYYLVMRGAQKMNAATIEMEQELPMNR